MVAEWLLFIDKTINGVRAKLTCYRYILRLGECIFHAEEAETQSRFVTIDVTQNNDTNVSSIFIEQYLCQPLFRTIRKPRRRMSDFLRNTTLNADDTWGYQT